jgi:hypothetical protein
MMTGIGSEETDPLIAQKKSTVITEFFCPVFVCHDHHDLGLMLFEKI